jgi:hypothetical protein
MAWKKLDKVPWVLAFREQSSREISLKDVHTLFQRKNGLEKNMPALCGYHITA